MRRQKLLARGDHKQKKLTDCLSFKAADGRKRCKHTGNDKLQRDKGIGPAAWVQGIFQIVCQYKEGVFRDDTALIFRFRPPGF